MHWAGMKQAVQSADLDQCVRDLSQARPFLNDGHLLLMKP